MAYPNYFPATYQPYYYQPVQQAQQQMQTSIIWVGSEQEAQNYPVAPNNAVALWDSSTPAIYLKQADASGKPILKAYDLVERSKTAQAESFAQGYKITDFATKSDTAALSEEIATIKGEIKALRKSMRKQEVDDDE